MQKNGSSNNAEIYQYINSALKRATIDFLDIVIEATNGNNMNTYDHDHK